MRSTKDVKQFWLISHLTFNLNGYHTGPQPGKSHILKRCLVNVGPSSQTVHQLWTNRDVEPILVLCRASVADQERRRWNCVGLMLGRRCRCWPIFTSPNRWYYCCNIPTLFGRTIWQSALCVHQWGIQGGEVVGSAPPPIFIKNLWKVP